MSTRLPKIIANKTPRNIGKSEKFDNAKSAKVSERISCDYDAALSQPDLTTFFKKHSVANATTDCQNDVNEKATGPPKFETEKKISEKFAQVEMEKSTKTDSAQSLGRKNKPVGGKKCGEKLSVGKSSRTSKIPRARCPGFTRLPLRSRAKKPSNGKISTTKSKSAVAGGARQVERTTETSEEAKNPFVVEPLSVHNVTLVVPDSKSIFSEEKCSGIDGDVELDADQEFTTSTDNSPGRIINMGNSSISCMRRASKLSCACRSCNDAISELPGQRVKSEIWTDSRSSPEVGRYANSGRNGLPKTRRLPEVSESRGFIDETTDESEVEQTTDFSSYESSRMRRTKRGTSSDIPRPVGIVAKKSIAENSTARLRSRSRMTFSFFDTLFDIVFWPFIFFRNDR